MNSTAMTRRFSRRSKASRLLVAMLSAVILAAGADTSMAQFDKPVVVDPLVDWPLEADPKIEPLQPAMTFDKRLAPLWFQALNHDNSQMRHDAANTIASAASQGMTGLEITIDRLASILLDEQEKPAVRLAAARALVALDAKAHAAALWKANLSQDREIALVTDPALARWKHEPAIRGWEQRLSDAHAPLTLRLSAIRALAMAEDTSAADSLIKVAHDRSEPASVRLAAAKAVPVLFAGKTASGLRVVFPEHVTLTDKLVSASLLQALDGDEAIRQLEALADDGNSAVAALAAGRLFMISPARLDSRLGSYGKSGDIHLRRIALARYNQQATAAALEHMSVFLGDVDPYLRMEARGLLLAHADNAQLQPMVGMIVSRLLGSESAHAREHAALMAGEMKLEATSQALLSLLESKDAAVALAAAVSLRKMALPGTFDAAQQFVEANMAKETTQERAEVAAQLVQMLGRKKHAPIEPVLRKLVPKESGPLVLRRAAVWSLGWLHEGTPDAPLIAELTRRANDGMGMNPEDGSVRELAVVTIARMKSPGSVAAFKRWMANTEDPSLVVVSHWALEHVTGEKQQPLDAGMGMVSGWFLEPMN